MESLDLISAALQSGATPDPARLEAVACSLAADGSGKEARASGILDAARFFYISGRPQVGVRIAELAKSYSVETAQISSTIAAANLVGVCSADTGNLPRAMEAYADALNLAKKVSDFGQEAKIWLNTGAALIYSGLFREAQACFQRVLELGVLANAAQDFVPQSYMNLALCALNLDDPSSGLGALKKGLDLLPEPNSAHSIQNRVLLENYYTRLLIEISDFDSALAHARTAREYANKSKSPRSDIQASVAEGLAETFSGSLDVGISRLTGTLERAKALNLASREVLVALVKALEYGGRHDEALKYLQEMISQQRKTAEANVLHHVHQHLVQLHRADANSPIEDVKQVMRRMETRLEVVEGRVAKVEVIRQRQELFKSRIEAMERLAVAAELRDDSTGEHSYRVGRMACLLAKEAGCDDETILFFVSWFSFLNPPWHNAPFVQKPHSSWVRGLQKA